MADFFTAMAGAAVVLAIWLVIKARQDRRRRAKMRVDSAFRLGACFKAGLAEDAEMLVFAQLLTLWLELWQEVGRVSAADDAAFGSALRLMVQSKRYAAIGRGPDGEALPADLIRMLMLAAIATSGTHSREGMISGLLAAPSGFA